MSVNRNPYFGFNSTQEHSLRGLSVTTPGGIDAVLLADSAVTTAKINAGAVTLAKLAADSVDSSKIVAGSIVNSDINASAAIALSKLANVAAGTDGLAGGTVQAQLQAMQTFMNNLNVWAIALATKLNADAGVTDTNYDTNPQA